MKDYIGMENAVLIRCNEEIVDMIGEDAEDIWYAVKVEEEGVYKIEYPRKLIEGIEVYLRSGIFNTKTNIVQKSLDYDGENYSELFYFEEGKKYYIKLKCKITSSFETYLLKILPVEVPAYNTLENSREVFMNEEIIGNIDYVTDIDWYKFKTVITCDIRIFYSKDIEDKISIYKDKSNKALDKTAETKRLSDGRIADCYQLECDTYYYISVKHNKEKKLSKYCIEIRMN